MVRQTQRIVIAVVVKNGKIVSFATNEHKEPCKRIGYPTGIGYELCKWCDYPNHAEYKAVQGIKNAVCCLIGHAYACDNCKKELKKRNICLKIIKTNASDIFKK